MDRVTLGFKLDGNVPLEQFKLAVDAFVQLLNAVTSHIDRDAPIRWFVSDLQFGSATLQAAATAENADALKVARAVQVRTMRAADSARRKQYTELSRDERKALAEFTSVVGDGVTGAKIETESEEVVFDAPVLEPMEPTAFEGPGRPHARTSIKGQIVLCDDKQGLTFTLREAFTKRSIRCYPPKEFQESIGRYFGKQTWVIVEGTLNRFTDKPVLTQITEILALPDVEPGAWRKVVGLIERDPDVKGDSASIVRRVRDGE
jgi:hypothetical protein